MALLKYWSEIKNEWLPVSTVGGSSTPSGTAEFKKEIVSSLPSNPDPSTIYLLASAESGTDDNYTEYINVNGAWEKLGSVDTVSSELSDLEASGDDIDLLF